MILIADRRSLAQDIQIARDAGARLKQVCEIAGIDARTLQRWKAHEGLTQGDGRPQALRPPPSHALSEAERAKLLSVANEPRFCAVPPARIVPMLADEGVYLASESTFARVLRAHGQTAHRGRAKAPKARRPPTTHIATAARQVWCWDMTYLPATVIGRWFHLYLILDLYSRKIVGWEVHADDSSNHAAHLVRRTALAEGIAALTDKPVLHGDNGSTLKATTVLAMLNWLGVKPSYSRPRVSDDNAYAESLFRTAKYRPEFPVKGYETLEGARHSCIGPTWNTSTAASATCRRSSAIPVKTRPFWRLAMRCTSRPRSAIRHAGPAIHATGAPWVRSPSTLNVTPLSRSTLRKSIFSHWLRKLGDNYLDARRLRQKRGFHRR
jgi:transposase InsO family protein